MSGNCMGGPSGEEKPEDHISTGTYSCFSSDVSSSGNHSNNLHQTHLLQSFEPTPEIYNLTSSMEMIGFPPPPKSIINENVSSTWKGLFLNNKLGINRIMNPSSSKAINDPTDHDNHQFYQQHHVDPATDISDHHRHHETTDESSMMVSWSNNTNIHHHGQMNRSLVMDDPSLRCVFPCEANERPSQGLSLSLSSSNPSSIGLQSFELRSQNDHHNHDLRFGPSSSRSVNIHQQINHQQSSHHEFLQVQFQIRNSKYLSPAQELLTEFCSLGTKQQTDHKMKAVKNNNSEWEDENINSAKKQALYSLDLMELQRRNTKLLQMLEEVDRRYKHYCNQMKAVVSSFEAVAGEGSPSVYSALASKAMSRHFRCLRDGIVSQIKVMKKAMGDKDQSVAAATIRGETPRLRILDQTLRQQKAIQQMSMMETHPWRPQRGLPERSVSILRAWLFEHFLHPYPSDVDKHILARQTGLSRSQVSNWFINARVRLWKPMVEDMYLEELKEQEGGGTTTTDNIIGSSSSNHNNQLQDTLENHFFLRIEDQKPSHDQLVRSINDPERLSSIINNNNSNKNKKIETSATTVFDDDHHTNSHEPYFSFGRLGVDQISYDGSGAMELDFSSYGAGGGGDHRHYSGGGGGGSGGGVSLTLGLHHHQNVTDHHHGGGLAFSSSQSSVFYNPTREEDGGHHHQHMEDCDQTVQYSLLDGDQGQTNLPYRNLVGAQLLHDLAG